MLLSRDPEGYGVGAIALDRRPFGPPRSSARMAILRIINDLKRAINPLRTG